MACDMCGKDEQLFKTIIEGTELNACKGCSMHGKVIKRIVPQLQKTSVKTIQNNPEPEVLELIAPNYSTLIRERREKLGLTQEDFAKLITEKESLVHKMEISQFEPSISLAKKLERLLHIKLVEELKDTKSQSQQDNSSTSGMTIGDLIKVRKR